MSTYRNLLLSTGGGVIGNSQRDEQEACATIAIGLGGTGVACLRNLKRQVYARVQPDTANDVMPTYSHIRFLAVDTDRNSLGADGKINSLDEVTEFFDISTSNIGALLAQPHLAEQNPEMKWLKTANPEQGEEGLKILSADAGAGGVRQIGRLLMMQKSAEFVHKVGQVINDAKRGFPTGCDVNIHVFTGMGGGTGSGIFLDVCYLIKQALRNVGEYGHALTCGYFFLPDVNLSIPALAANPTVSEFVKINGFAAMKELDYCMNFENNGGCWNQQYMGFRIGPDREAPVKICHLVSAHATNGATLDNGFDYAMNVVCDFVMQFVVKNSITMNTHIANYYQAMSRVKKMRGANYTYCLLGAASAVVPMKEIATYLSSKLFEGMAQIGGILPSDEDIAAFADSNDLTYPKLKKRILNGTSSQMPFVQLDYKMFTGMSEEDLGLSGEIVLPELIDKPFTVNRQKMINHVTANQQAMAKAWSWDEILKGDTAENSGSVSCGVYTALAAVVQDGSRGPFYAAAILNGSERKNLVSLLRGAAAQAQKEYDDINKNQSLRIEEIKTARTAFLHPKGLFARPNQQLFDNFMRRVQRYHTDQASMEALQKLRELINALDTQLTSLYDDCFFPYTQVSQNLIDTFHENYMALTGTATAQAVADPFVVQLVDIQDENMRDSLDVTVEKMNLGNEASAFHTALFSKAEVWNAGDERRIFKCVSDYLVRKFSGYTNRTLTDYLQIIYGTQNPNELSEKVYANIFSPLDDKAAPLFWKDGTYSIATASPLGYCSVPSAAAAVQAAAIKLKKARPELQPVTSGWADRIFLLRCTCGVPLFAYNGIPSYGEMYEHDTEIGKHIYEGTARDDRNWKNLFNLRPFSALAPAEYTGDMETNSKNYDRAVALKIIRNDLNAKQNYHLYAKQNYHLYVMPSAQKILTDIDLAVKKNDPQLMDQAEQALDVFEKTAEPERKIIIPNDGMKGHEETVRKDHVMASAELCRLIAEQLKQKDDIAAAREKLANARAAMRQAKEEAVKQAQAAQAEANRMMDRREEYFNALFTGVIEYRRPNQVLYLREEYGIVDEIVLSKPSVAPYGAKAPLYQGYITYSEKPEDEREEICKASMGRMEKAGDELKAACDSLTEIFTNPYMKAMQDQAKTLPDPEKTAEIVAFLKEFRKSLDNFKIMYGLQ